MIEFLCKKRAIDIVIAAKFTMKYVLSETGVEIPNRF